MTAAKRLVKTFWRASGYPAGVKPPKTVSPAGREKLRSDTAEDRRALSVTYGIDMPLQMFLGKLLAAGWTDVQVTSGGELAGGLELVDGRWQPWVQSDPPS